MMDTTPINLPPELARQVDRMVEAGKYEDGTHYIHDLLRRDAERMQAMDTLADRLAEGINSGEPMEVTSEYWARKKQALSEKMPDSDRSSA